MPDGVSFLMPILGVLMVIFLAYGGTKWLAKKYTGMAAGKYVRVRERISLGTDKSLALVQAGHRVFLIGISSKGMETLAEFPEEDFPAEKTSQKKTDFQGILLSAMKTSPAMKHFFHKNQDRQDHTYEDKP